MDEARIEVVLFSADAIEQDCFVWVGVPMPKLGDKLVVDREHYQVVSTSFNSDTRELRVAAIAQPV